ncbi:MAG TPA: hypothetical protein VFC63_07265 [Blastocatellia bacterium]|nr:hypothetical protein [Blastocatellia bacterium]
MAHNRFCNPSADATIYTFTNNRCTSLYSYDAMGNTTSSSSTYPADTYTYDAAGKGVTSDVWSYPTDDLVTQTYDGDGNSVYHDLQHTANSDDTNNYEMTSHYLRSTVLGGKIFDELTYGSSGHQIYVYANGELLAKPTPSDDTIDWQVTNPVSHSTVDIMFGTGSGSMTELSPMGQETGTSNPYSYDPAPTYSEITGSLYVEGGNPFDGGGGLEINGMANTPEELRRQADAGNLDYYMVDFGGNTVAGGSVDTIAGHVVVDLYHTEHVALPINHYTDNWLQIAKDDEDDPNPDTTGLRQYDGTSYMSVSYTVYDGSVSFDLEGQTKGQRPKKTGQLSDLCKGIKEELLGNSYNKAALDDAWNKSGYGTPDKHEVGGLLGISQIGNTAGMPVNAIFQKRGRAASGMSGDFVDWIINEIKGGGAVYHYAYVTHPFDKDEILQDRDPDTGGIKPGSVGKGGDPSDVMRNYDNAAIGAANVVTGSHLLGVLISKKYLTVYNDDGKIVCPKFER